MGREIRRVPKGWEHPKNENGEYISMQDATYEDAAQEWIEFFHQWEAGTHKGQASYYKHYWEYDPPPDKEVCRPKFEGEPVCYQIYQTVSEGTPTSPVFETLAEMEKWLIGEGYSDEAAKKFTECGWAPSMVISGGVAKMDIQAMEDC